MLYGQAVPALGGVVSGVLAQDAGKVAAVFTTNGGCAVSGGRVYDCGDADGPRGGRLCRWGVGPVGSLSIAQAPTLTTLSVLTSSLGSGSVESLSVQAVSTTSGVPTGSVTVSDGTTVLGVVGLAGGAAAFSTSTLALGTHHLSAAYSGDGNFLGSTSAVATVTVGVAQDFTLASMGAISQAVPAGSAATYSFSRGDGGCGDGQPDHASGAGIAGRGDGKLQPELHPTGGGGDELHDDDPDSAWRGWRTGRGRWRREVRGPDGWRC